jgi:hypothetical protein
MKEKVNFDGRDTKNVAEVCEKSFTYYGIGFNKAVLEQLKATV